MEQRPRQRPIRAAPGIRAALLGSVALHAAAGAAAAVALAWHAVPAPPGAPPALEVVWLPPAEIATGIAAPVAGTPGAAAEIAPLGPAAVQGVEPEDALATQVGALHLPPAPPAPATALPPLPIPDLAPPEPPADPTSLFAALAVPSPTPPAAGPDEALPLPPPLPAPPRRRVAAAPTPPAARPAQPVALAPPAPPPAETAPIPVLSGAPRFRRPPAPPDYPARAREAGVEGTALLRLRITAEGITQEVRLLRSTGHRMLDEAAQAAARRWEITPPTQGGRPIEAWVEVPVRFRLDE